MMMSRPTRRTHPLPRIRLTRRFILPALIMLLAGGACGGTETSTTPDPTEGPNAVTTIRIAVADQTITAQLADNPTAQDLAKALPLTLTISDYNRVEKVADLPRPLTTDGVPAGDDPDINDIGYYAPSRSLVFYYGDVGYWNGIVRIGRLSDRDIQLIEQQPDETVVMIEHA